MTIRLNMPLSERSGVRYLQFSAAISRIRYILCSDDGKRCVFFVSSF